MTVLEQMHSPALRGLRHVTPLVGRSGAGVYLASEDGRRWFVRKVAAGEPLAARLRRQVAKQQAFRRSVGELVPAPAIRAEASEGDRYWCDMDLVRGEDAATFLQRATYAEVSRFGDLWCDYLRAAGARPALPVGSLAQPSLHQALAAKVAELAPVADAVGPQVATFLDRELDELARRPAPAPTLCHGDLTLENVIVTPSGQPWVLDLLDAPFESVWFDVAKLHQDLSAGWHRVRDIGIGRGVLSHLSRRLIATMVDVDPGYRPTHPLLLVVTLLRVLPYATADREVAFLHRQIRSLANHGSERSRSRPRTERSAP